MGNLMYESGGSVRFQYADEPVRATLTGNTLVLEVNAMINAVADSYLAIFHITQLGQSAAEADSLMDQRIARLQARVKQHGVDDADFFTDMLSFVPVYEFEATRKLFSTTYQEIPAGFEVQKNVHIRFTDARILDKLVTAAAIEEIYDLVKVDYFVGEQSACYDTLRTVALELLKRKLAGFAKLGLRLEESHRTAAEAKDAYFPLDRYTMYQTRTQTSLNSRRKGQTVNDVRTPVAHFYNKVPYGQFDIVLHPEVTEPPVQFTYHLVVHCQLPEAFSDRKKEVKEIMRYMLITGNGELKELRM